MNTPTSTRQPLQAIGNRYLPAKLQHKSNPSSPASIDAKRHAPSSSSMLSSSPPRSARSFAFTSSPAPNRHHASSIASSSPPPATPRDAPRHSYLFNGHEKTQGLSIPEKSNIEHVNLEASSQTITMMIGECVHIGRKLKKVEETIRNAPRHQDLHFKLVTIPKAAKHASRHHCSLVLRPNEDDNIRLTLDIQVLGQNGMQLEGVKTPNGEKQVQVQEGDTVTLGFYTDFDVKVVCQSRVAKHVTKQEATTDRIEHFPTVPTSEATLGLDLEMDLEDAVEVEAEEEEQKPVAIAKEVKPKPVMKMISAPSSPAPVAFMQSASKKRQGSRESSIQPAKRAQLSSEARSSPAPSPYAHQDDDGYPPEDSSESEDEERIERRKNAELQDSYVRVRTAIETLSLDLVGILASGIVFQPRATLTTSECIHLLLETQPSLLEHGTTEAWRPSVLAALRNGPFGVIENEGLKDAAGKKVEPDWHYNPELDNDSERKNSLKPFVKSIRSTQRQKKQYFFKRPSDLKSRRW